MRCRRPEQLNRGCAILLNFFCLVAVFVLGPACPNDNQCKKSVKEFNLWLKDLRHHISKNYYGDFYGELVGAIYPYPRVAPKREERVEIKIYPGWVQYSAYNFIKENELKAKLKEHIGHLAVENEDLYALIFVDEGVQWDLFIDVLSVIVDQKIESAVLVFEWDGDSIRPPKSDLTKKLNKAKKKIIKDAIEKKKHYIYMPFENLGHYLPGCPELKSFFDKFGSPGVQGRLVFIEMQLPEIIRSCDCEPPAESIKSVLWHYYYWGKSRVGLRVKLCLEPCSKCNIVALHDDVPWATAAKVVMKEHASSPERPFCFKSIEDSEEKSRGRATGEPKVRH